MPELKSELMLELRSELSPVRSLVLDLFRYLRSHQVVWTMEQFDRLAVAVEAGYGVESWASLRRVCRVVWAMPEESRRGFERAFDQYQECCMDAGRSFLAGLPETVVEPIALEPELGQWPRLPPRIFPGEAVPSPKQSLESDVSQGNEQGATAVKQARSGLDAYVLRDLPSSLEQVKQVGRSLRLRERLGTLREFDLERTVECIGREGVFSQVVERPVMGKRSEILVLVDDDDAMIPYGPVVEPWVRSVLENRLESGRIYRFTRYPVKYLYEWRRSTQAVVLERVLQGLSRSRSVVVIASDAGAASGSYGDRQVRETVAFLERLRGTVRSVLWLNPVPKALWAETSAMAIADGLVGLGQMVEMDGVGAAVREMAMKGGRSYGG